MYYDSGMNILFVHQNFFGWFKSLAPALINTGRNVHALSIGGEGLSSIDMTRDKPACVSGRDLHLLGRDFET